MLLRSKLFARFESISRTISSSKLKLYFAAKASGAWRSYLLHITTHSIESSLRIAPETYLKRAVVGGFERVFEFAKCFRNEGMDPHIWVFTMLEYYAIELRRTWTSRKIFQIFHQELSNAHDSSW
jgi:lysyl-tRNA synthetase class 2